MESTDLKKRNLPYVNFNNIKAILRQKVMDPLEFGAQKNIKKEKLRIQQASAYQSH